VLSRALAKIVGRIGDCRCQNVGHNLAAADSLAATAKHFCAYGAVTAGREYASVDLSERTLREVYLPPFSAARCRGGSSNMPAFIDIAGVPMTANARRAFLRPSNSAAMRRWSRFALESPR
jgi:beta-glucosidase-like glycosyl hydrolase